MNRLECDDMMEGEPEYCAFDHRYCDENRMTCKKADDYYFKQDGQHYYQRFVVFKNRYHDETGKLQYSYSLKDLQGEFEDVPLVNKEDADTLIYFLYQLCDIIDELGGVSECLNHSFNKRS